MYKILRKRKIMQLWINIRRYQLSLYKSILCQCSCLLEPFSEFCNKCRIKIKIIKIIGNMAIKWVKLISFTSRHHWNNFLRSRGWFELCTKNVHSLNQQNRQSGFWGKVSLSNKYYKCNTVVIIFSILVLCCFMQNQLKLAYIVQISEVFFY